MLLRFIAIGVLVTGALMASCKGHAPPEDTDKELFRTPEALTSAREQNIAKWTADFLRANRRLPANVSELVHSSTPDDPKEDPLNDGWGHALVLSPLGKGFEVRSYGVDGVPNTSDDLIHRVDDPATVP